MTTKENYIYLFERIERNEKYQKIRLIDFNRC